MGYASGCFEGGKMYKQAVEYIKQRIGRMPKIGLVLGTGLGEVADCIAVETEIPYEEIPGFPISTVDGHAGRFLAGWLSGQFVLVMQGRVHFYEGYTMQQLAMPIQTMRSLGIETVIVTNASGGINPAYTPGDVVLISDHIKFDLESPLRGENPQELGERFFDMTHAYTPKLRELAKAAAEKLGIDLLEGVYAYMGGPQFETPAEIRMLRLLGADLVGMSTVPEVISAVHCGMQVLGLSCVTNMAAGMDQGGFNQKIIAEAEDKGKLRLRELLTEVVGGL